jgi:hypothetical protein
LSHGNKGTEIILQELAKEAASMEWIETVKQFAVEVKKRAEVREESSVNKKQKSEDSRELFDDNDEDDEMWGIVGDDDEFLE